MNGHGNEMTGYDPEDEQMSDLWREWEWYEHHREAERAAKIAERLVTAAAAVGVVVLWFFAAIGVHDMLTR